MKLTEPDVDEIILKLKPNRFTLPNITTLMGHICEKLEIAPDEKLKSILKIYMVEFKRKQKEKQKQWNTLRSKSCASNALSITKVLVDSDDFESVKCDKSNKSDNDVQDNENEPKFKKRKSFCSLTKRMQRIRTDEIISYLKTFLHKENDENNDCDLDISKLLGYLLYRVNYINNKSLATIGWSIFEDTIESKSNFEIDDGIAVMHDFTFTKEQCRVFKSYLTNKGIHFPNTNELLEARKKLRPVIHEELNGEGVSVDYKELVEMTSASLINMLKADGIKIKSSEPVNIVYKDGCDTAGSQSVWNAKSMNYASDHLFQYSIVPLRLEQDSVVLWKNPTPNSPECTRPVYLLRASEDDEGILNYVIPTTDDVRTQLNSSNFELTDLSGVNYTVTHMIHDTMKDLKLKKKISGLGGADCIICTSRQKDWMNVESINLGFPINRSRECSMDLFEQLISGDGVISRKSGDYEIRLGMTHKPITRSDQHSICVLHSYINTLGWFLKVLYRCNQLYEFWVEKTIIGEHIRVGRQNVQKILFQDHGLRLDQVSGANDKGGTSNDGNQARRFFSIDTADSIVNCVAPKYKDTVRKLHMNLSTLLRIISCTSQIDVSKLNDLAIETSLLIAMNLKWVNINYTLHGLLHHCVELIEANNGWSIGTLSEEALESNNKFVRRYLERFSRKTSPNEQLRDAMSRLLERSDPCVINIQRKQRSSCVCDVCGKNIKQKSSKLHE